MSKITLTIHNDSEYAKVFSELGFKPGHLKGNRHPDYSPMDLYVGDAPLGLNELTQIDFLRHARAISKVCAGKRPVDGQCHLEATDENGSSQRITPQQVIDAVRAGAFGDRAKELEVEYSAQWETNMDRLREMNRRGALGPDAYANAPV